MDFLESSFFKNHDPHKHLRTPEEVRALSKKPSPRPDPVKFEGLGLIIKFRPHMTVEEVLRIWAIRRVPHDSVPVPELYGWRVDRPEAFIYMELIRGDSLKERWDALGDDDRVSICDQLRKIMASL